MKKNYYIFLFFQFLFLVPQYSQFTVTHDTETYQSNVVLITSSLESPGNEIGFNVNNISGSLMKFKIATVELINNDGTTMQVCIGTNCYAPGVTVGEVFPSGNPASIAVGGYSYVHLVSTNSGIATGPVDFKFKIYQVNDLNQEIGTPFFFTYRYDATAGTNELKNNSNVYPTLATDVVYVTSDVKLKTTLMDMQGRWLQTNDAVINPVINVAELAPQTYLLICEDEHGNQFTQKIVKQ